MTITISCFRNISPKISNFFLVALFCSSVHALDSLFIFKMQEKIFESCITLKYVSSLASTRGFISLKDKIYMDNLCSFRKSWPNTWHYSKAKNPTKTNSRICIQAKFGFWQDTHIFLLFKLGEQLKMHSSYLKTLIHDK